MVLTNLTMREVTALFLEVDSALKACPCGGTCYDLVRIAARYSSRRLVSSRTRDISVSVSFVGLTATLLFERKEGGLGVLLPEHQLADAASIFRFTRSHLYH